MKYFIASLLLLFFWSACITPENKSLPYLGERRLAANGDTIYPSIRDFTFIDQDSQWVNNATFANKIYVVDFFFIHCPTICPKVKANGLRIYQKFLHDNRIMLLSHTIDVKNDTIAALRQHAEKLHIDSQKWKLVTGNKDDIYSIADDYYSIAKENPEAPGGFDHSGRLILVDKNRHVRSFCNGTDAEDTDRFMHDIEILLKEQFPTDAK